MKKLHVISVSVLVAVLYLAVTACNQSMIAGNGTGEVRVVIGGGAARSVNAEGLPIFDDTNTTITVIDEEGTVLGSGTLALTLKVGIGKKITVKALVKTAAGEWIGLAEHTVAAGTNTISVKLSKAIKNLSNILIDVKEDTNNSVAVKLAGGKELLAEAAISQPDNIQPAIARDRIGRIYAAYKEPTSGTNTSHFKRFNVEGTEELDISSTSPSPWNQAVENCIGIAVDTKTDMVFLAARASGPSSLVVYCTKPDKTTDFTPLCSQSITRIDPDIEGIHAIAAYNGMLYLAVKKYSNHNLNLLACKVELLVAALILTKKDMQELPHLRDDDTTRCTGLFADERGVYCILTEQCTEKDADKGRYAVGELICYQYSGDTLAMDKTLGRNPRVQEHTPNIAFDAQYFSNPVGFIGSDEENLYIADDGINFEYINENININGNRNRIAAFNRRTGTLTFSDTETTWYTEYPKYTPPNTQVLVWGKDPANAMKYWTSVDGTGGFSAPPLLNLPSSSVLKPGDVFCYDQDGNLYILYYDGQYKVKRFPLKADGTYDTSLAEELELSGLTTTETLKAIAVDISDGQYSVYCAASNTIEKFSSHNSFNHVMKDSSYTINVSLPLTITALAANKDGVFVGVCPERSATDYTLQVWKYHKQDGTYLGQVLVGTVQPPIQDTPPSTQDYYKRVVSTINDLQVVNGVLYAITSNKEEGMEHTTAYITDSFKMSSALYKVGNTARTFSGSAELLCNRPAVEPEGLAATGTGYNFYRFNAVKPQKLVIASDGAWGKDGSSVSTPGLYMNYNKVFEYDLARQDVSERNAGGTFSKELEFGTGFDWQ